MTIALAGTAHALEPMVADLAGANGGALGWPQLERLGHSPDDVARWVRAGQLVRVRRGAYVVGDVWRSADADDRYRLTVLAVVRSRGGHEVVSRHSALALWDLPLWAVDRALVVLSSDVEESQTRSGLRLSPLRSLVADEPRHGVRLEAVADAVVTTASFSVEAAVVAGDAAVHSGLCTPADLADAAARLRPSLRGGAASTGRWPASTRCASHPARAAPACSWRPSACPWSRRSSSATRSAGSWRASTSSSPAGWSWSSTAR